MQRTTIETDRLKLIEVHKGDAARAAAFFTENADHLRPWQPSWPDGFLTEEFWQAELESTMREAEKGDCVRLWIVDGDDPDGALLGYASLTGIRNGSERCATLSYAVDHRAQGRGLATEAARALCDYAFDVLKLHRVDARYATGNAGSARILARLGFQTIGVAPEHAFVGGEWRDHVLTTRVAERATTN